MSNVLRSTGKHTVFWILLGMLVLGLGGFGVTNFSGGVRSIGSVGETSISTNEYARALQQELRALQAQVGQPIGMTEAKMLGVDQAVQARLFAQAAVDEQARKLGISVGDEAVGRQILTAQAFRGIDGKFDRESYKLALQQQGETEASFEKSLRAEAARSVLQGALVGGVKAPDVQVAAYTSYITENRAVTWAELTAADLPEALPEPTEEALRAYHDTHEAEFTRPETRKITYAELTPDMLVDTVKLDEAALKAQYDARIAEFVTPEKRLVEALTYPDQASAEAAKAELDAGTKTFADLAAARGLMLEDIDQGEQSKEELGAAGDAVFALTEPGVVGPINGPLGPTLYSMNGILAAQEVTFDEARADLASEAATDAARRQIADQAAGIEDQLAGGATLEDISANGAMKLTTIDWTAASNDDIAAYPEFRTAAAAVTAEDFPELKELSDGGVFALRLDEIVPPAVIPYEESAEAVRTAWEKDQLHQALLKRAEAVVAAVAEGKDLGAQGLLASTIGRLARGGFVEGAPEGLADEAFKLAPGTAGVVDAGGRVAVVQLNAVIASNPEDEAVQQTRASVEQQLSQGIAQDIIDLYARSAQAEAGLKIDTTAINAVQAQMQ